MEVFGIVASAVGIATAAKLTYGFVREKLGAAAVFKETKRLLPLIQETTNVVKVRKPPTAAKELRAVARDCGDNADAAAAILNSLHGAAGHVGYPVIGRLWGMFSQMGRRSRVADLKNAIFQELFLIIARTVVSLPTADEIADKVANKVADKVADKVWSKFVAMMGPRRQVMLQGDLERGATAGPRAIEYSTVNDQGDWIGRNILRDAERASVYEL
ncbi:hypothetical protein HYQ45_005681 [Verticillium longisporum]|uniref:NACHT-NTPase and P-loop NTPases N-terminal domain-containing protein n=1 Tax=Verticillium longisporum TaxID=100787 RepID=A0A8I2ZR56_VERLO|nr:hypothetical protein HYQ44_014587 [Verticillium longisporum]KAG7136929.1 hypothetical protein HYQ45_005681 [Verticillium longisporum]KAG7151702.1 hypothetical protein HYQ46_012502 [Verticillium longisporum]